jgi:hypothetical protein
VQKYEAHLFNDHAGLPIARDDESAGRIDRPKTVRTIARDAAALPREGGTFISTHIGKRPLYQRPSLFAACGLF